MSKQYVLDGERFSTLEEFWREVDRVMLDGVSWGHNLDAFNDILRGGFGTPPDGFEIVWRNHELSRQRLGDDRYQTLVDIIRIHTAGGQESEDNVVLTLD